MATKFKRHLFVKTVVLGGILASLLYLFHPGVGSFAVSYNGQPVAEPLFRLAAIPAVLLALALMGVLAFLAVLGVGMMLFMAMLGFAMLTVLIIAPYFWPVLLLFCLIILIMSLGNNQPD
jgi:hypothetical protein